MKTILVVDDEPRIVQPARDYLEDAGFAVLTAGDEQDPAATEGEREPDEALARSASLEAEQQPPEDVLIAVLGALRIQDVSQEHDGGVLIPCPAGRQVRMYGEVKGGSESNPPPRGEPLQRARAEHELPAEEQPVAIVHGASQIRSPPFSLRGASRRARPSFRTIRVRLVSR